MATGEKKTVCEKCSKCIYCWAGSCPGLSRFNKEKCVNMVIH